MKYGLIKNGIFFCYLPDGNYCFSECVNQPAHTLDADRKSFLGVVEIAETQKPAFNNLTQSCVQADAILINGAWTQQWTVSNLEPAVAAANESSALSANIDRLWKAADAYVTGYISGVAIGLLAIGVIQQKPKALAVSAWSSAIWDEYYRRKALITPTLGADLDFTSFGPIPHSVPELRTELGM